MDPVNVGGRGRGDRVAASLVVGGAEDVRGALSKSSTLHFVQNASLPTPAAQTPANEETA